MTKYYEMITRHDEERKSFEGENFFSFVHLQGEEIKKEIKKDTTGEGFIKDMFRYEMSNAEYHINQYKDSLLDHIGITEEEFENSKALQKGFDLAEKAYLKSVEKYFHF